MIRRARRGDAPAVAELEELNLGADAWPPGLVADGVAGEVPTATYWVAERDGRIVGHAVVSIVAEIAELQRISVVADARRAGIALALLATVEAQARDQGAERVLLEVREDNEGARAFYAAHGYAQIARRSRYYRDGAAAVVLARDLSR